MLTRFFGYVCPGMLLVMVPLMAVADNKGLHTTGDWVGFSILVTYLLCIVGTVWYLTWTAPRFKNAAWWE